MTPDLGRFGIWRRVGEIDAEMASEAESLGYGAIWVGGSPPGDLLAVEEILDATTSIPVITGIVNMWRVPAALLAESHVRIRSNHPGRFLLGVGIGHPESVDRYADPIAKIDTYLSELESSGVGGDEIVLAALGPTVLRIAGERTAGAHPYLTTHRHTAMARQILGAGPLLAPEHFVALSSRESALDKGRATVGRYLQLVNYRNSLLREGWDDSDLVDGGSDRLIQELVLSGDARKVVSGLLAHLEAGADHVSVQVIDGDVREAHRRLAEELFID